MSTTVEARSQTTSRPPERTGPSPFTRRKIVGYLVTLLTWVLVSSSSSPCCWMIINSFKTEARRAILPTPVLLHPDPRRLRRRVRPRDGAYLLNSFFALRRRHRRLRCCSPSRPPTRLSVRPISRWQDALFFFISTKFMPVAAVDHPGLPAAADLGRPATTWVARPSLPRHQPASRGLDDAVVLRRGALRSGRGGPDRRGQLQSASSWRVVAARSSLPGAAAAALICFIFAWNEYFLATLLTAVVARTTPPFLGSFVDGRGQFLAILSAASTHRRPPGHRGRLARPEAPRPRPGHGRSQVNRHPVPTPGAPR